MQFSQFCFFVIFKNHNLKMGNENPLCGANGPQEGSNYDEIFMQHSLQFSDSLKVRALIYRLMCIDFLTVIVKYCYKEHIIYHTVSFLHYFLYGFIDNISFPLLILICATLVEGYFGNNALPSSCNIFIKVLILLKHWQVILVSRVFCQNIYI